MMTCVNVGQKYTSICMLQVCIHITFFAKEQGVGWVGDGGERYNSFFFYSNSYLFLSVKIKAHDLRFVRLAVCVCLGWGRGEGG